MATTSVTGPSWKLEVEQEWIDVTPSGPTPNERWRTTDSNGHEHYYDHGYPTLDEVIDAQHWCNGTEGFALHDPHMQIDEWHYECKLCREVIEPDYDPPFTPKYIPGLRTATLTGVRSDGAEIVVDVREDELAGLHDDAAAQAFLDAAPMERIHSWSW